MYAIGEAMFYRRSAINDFSCATCHGEDGRRIRLQALPNLTKPSPPGPTGHGHLARLPRLAKPDPHHAAPPVDCYRQMRMPAPDYFSEGITALTVFLAHNGEGATVNAPYIKR
jgi:sulfur-oxidizing protein SoxA